MNEKQTKRTRLSELALVAATVLWGVAFAVVKDAARYIPPSWLVGLRFLLAGGIMALLFHRRLARLSRRTFVGGALMGSILFFAYLAQTEGVQYTTAGKNAFLTSVYVVITPFLYWGVRRVRPDLFNLLAAVVCLGGIGLLSLSGEGMSVGLGEALTLLSGLLYACHIVCTGVFTEDCDPMALNTVQFCVCGVLGIAAALLGREPLPRLTGSALAGLGYVTVFATLVGIGLQSACQKYVEPNKASLLMSLESVFGCLAGILLLGEQVTPRILAGFVLIFGAILLSEAPRRKHTETSVSLEEET